VVAVPNQGEHRIPEAKAAANVIGAECVFLYDEKPARVEDIPMHELVARMDRLLGATKPDLVITHSEHDLHWDHGLVNRATVSALRRTPCDLLAFLSSPQMNAQHRAIGQCFADITSTLETKIASIQEHKSQLAKLDIESSKDLARAMGRISGYGYAESYEALRVRI
jgi:LmbE family N-acetylglucosaminyl deacetylase